MRRGPVRRGRTGTGRMFRSSRRSLTTIGHLGIGRPLSGRLLVWDGLDLRFEEFPAGPVR